MKVEQGVRLFEPVSAAQYLLESAGDNAATRNHETWLHWESSVLYPRWTLIDFWLSDYNNCVAEY